ncbi:MAG: hypothetical protein K6B52_03555 [Clostridiales bacterium]|nr:hypothetical protein [Clostridiales bacterium]
MKKGLSVLLAMLMILCMVPFASFAEDSAELSAAERSEAWAENYQIVLDKLSDNEKSAHWRYVAENNESIAKKMITYTAFGLYDDAWKNGFDQSVSVDAAEQILVSLIDRVDANVGESKVATIVKILDKATDANDLIQKVNDILQKINKYAKAEALDKIDGVVSSNQWSTAFKYIEWGIKAGNLYLECRDRVIEAYAQILSVQAANVYYLDFLKYIVDNSEYDVLQEAAYNLSNDINKSVDEIIKGEVLKASGFAASRVLATAARIAADTNTYTAVAQKVYNKATSIADTLWNTSDQFALMDELYTTFFAENCANDWAKEADNEDAYVFGIGTLLSLRQVGAETLYNLKVAQNGGVIGMIKDQINANITFENHAELAFIDLADDVLFADNYDDAKVVDSIVTVTSKAFTVVDGNAIDNVEGIYDSYNTKAAVRYDEAQDRYVKVYFISGDADLRLRYPADTLATLIIESYLNGAINDYSFTDITVGDGVVATLSTNLSNGATYNLYDADGNLQVKELNDDFVYPVLNEVTTKAVIKAVEDIAVKQVKIKVTSIFDLIKSYFAKIVAAIGKIF